MSYKGFTWRCWSGFLLILLLIACGNDNANPVATPNLASSTSAATTMAAPKLPVNATSPGISQTLTSADSTAALTALSQAARDFSKLQSLHLILEIRQGKVEINGATVKQVAGDVAQPDKYQAQVRVGTFLGDFSLPVIGIGGQQYMKNEFGGWGLSNAQQTVNLAELLDGQAGLGPTLLKMQNVRVLGKENLGGVEGPVYHLQGEVAGSDLTQLTFNKLSVHPATLDVWVTPGGTGEAQVVQVYLKENGTGSDLAFWTFALSKFNEAVQIQKPTV